MSSENAAPLSPDGGIEDNITAPREEIDSTQPEAQTADKTASDAAANDHLVDIPDSPSLQLNAEPELISPSPESQTPSRYPGHATVDDNDGSTSSPPLPTDAEPSFSLSENQVPEESTRNADSSSSALPSSPPQQGDIDGEESEPTLPRFPTQPNFNPEIDIEDKSGPSLPSSPSPLPRIKTAPEAMQPRTQRPKSPVPPITTSTSVDEFNEPPMTAPSAATPSPTRRILLSPIGRGRRWNNSSSSPSSAVGSARGGWMSSSSSPYGPRRQNLSYTSPTSSPSHVAQSSAPLDRVEVWTDIFKCMRDEDRLSNNGLEKLKQLENDVRNISPALEPNRLKFAIVKKKDKLENTQDSTLGVSEEAQREFREMVNNAMMAISDLVNKFLSEDAAFQRDVSGRICEIIYDAKKEVEEAGHNADKLSEQNLRSKSKPVLVTEFIKYIKEMDAKVDSYQDEIDRLEQTIKRREAEKDEKEKLLDEQKKKESERVRAAMADYGETTRIAQTPASVPLQQPVLLQKDSSEDSRSRRCSMVDKSTSTDADLDLPTEKERIAAANNKADQAAKRQEARQKFLGIMSGCDTVETHSRLFIQQHAGLSNSGPPSTRDRLSLSASAWSRDTPLKSSLVSSDAQLRGLGQQTLHDEFAGHSSVDASSEPPTESDVKTPPDPGLRTHNTPPRSKGHGQLDYASQPRRYQSFNQPQTMPINRNFAKDHEPTEYKIDCPTPSTLSLDILARFIEEFSRVPSKFHALVEKLVLIGKIDEGAAIIQQHLKVLGDTVIQLNSESPYALPEHAPLSKIQEWIDQAGPFLDGLVKVFDDGTEQMLRAVDRWQQIQSQVEANNHNGGPDTDERLSEDEQSVNQQKDRDSQPPDKKRHVESLASTTLWRQVVLLLYGLIRWLTWGQMANVWIILMLMVSLLRYCWYSLQCEVLSGILTPDLRRRSLRPLQAPKIPGDAFSSLCLWTLFAWNAMMLVSMKEERRLWLAANLRTARYVRGLSSRYPYPWWSPFEVDYSFIEPAWGGLSIWLHEAHFRNGFVAMAEALYKGNAPALMKSTLSFLGHPAKMALMQVGIQKRQDILRVL